MLATPPNGHETKIWLSRATGTLNGAVCASVTTRMVIDLDSAGKEIGGGGGNRTPVRRFSVKYDYMLSRCFSFALRAPNGRVSQSQPVWISASSPPAEESAYPTE